MPISVRHCIIKAARYLGLERLAVDLENDMENEEDLPLFLSLCSDVAEEINADYCPIKSSASIKLTENGSFDVNLLSMVLDVLNITLDGKEIEFYLENGKVYLPQIKSGQTVKVDFSQYISVYYIDQELSFPSRVTTSVIGYGIAAAYALLHLYDNASLLERQYRDRLKLLRNTFRPDDYRGIKKRERIVRKRAWL